MNNELQSAFGACKGQPEKAFETEKSAVSSGFRRDSIEKSAAAFSGFRAFCMPGHKGKIDSLDQSEHDEDCLFPAKSVTAAEQKAARRADTRFSRELSTN